MYYYIEAPPVVQKTNTTSKRIYIIIEMEFLNIFTRHTPHEDENPFFSSPSLYLIAMI
jgi:hypothetical protein